MEKIWKDVKGYENLYRISNYGEVYSEYKKRLMKLQKNKDGYLRVSLYKDEKMKHFLVHRLVAMNFLPKPESENQTTVNHINGIKTDNCVNNLEWASHYEQTKHACEIGLMHGNFLSEKEKEEIRSLYKPYSKEFGLNGLAKLYNVSQVTIFEIVKNKSNDKEGRIKKLSNEQTIEIRNLYTTEWENNKLRDLAKKYNVSVTTISRVVNYEGGYE